MEIIGYKNIKNIEYRPKIDSFTCTYNIELKFEEANYHIECEIYSTGNSGIWSVGKMFFEEGRMELNTTNDIRYFLEDNMDFLIEPLLEQYREISEIYKNSIPLWLMKFSITQTKVDEDEKVKGWVLDIFVTNEMKYLTMRVKQGYPQLSIKQKGSYINWDSNNWYPGWKQDAIKQIKGFLKEWNYSTYFYKKNKFHQKIR